MHAHMCTQSCHSLPLSPFCVQGRNTATNDIGWFPCNKVKPYVYVSVWDESEDWGRWFWEWGQPWKEVIPVHPGRSLSLKP